MFRDWENHHAYLTKKFFEVSLDQLMESVGDSGIRIRSVSTFNDLCKSQEQVLEEAEEREELYRKVQEIYTLLRDSKFFTDRQRQVLGLLFGWNGPNYVGPKSISDIAKVIGISQPVAYNHLRLAVRKLRKHFGVEKKAN